MSIVGLQAALTGLSASAKAMDTVAKNVANLQNPDYTNQLKFSA